MKLRLYFTFVLLVGLASPSVAAFAGWGCVFDFIRLSKEPKSILSGLSEKGRQRLEVFVPGDEVSLKIKGVSKNYRLHEMNFDGAVVESDGVVAPIRHHAIEEIVLISRPTQLDSVSELLAPRLSFYLAARTGRIEYLRSLDQEQQVWSEIASAVVAEIEDLRKLRGANKTQRIVDTGQEIAQQIAAKFQSSKIGFHYNLHGGSGRDYVGTGIRGSVTADISTHTDPWAARRYQTYFFNSLDHTLFEVLNSRHPGNPWMRMGSTLIIFRLDSDFFNLAASEGGILDSQSVYLHFNQGWLNRHAKAMGLPYTVAVPATEYLASPLNVFRKTAAKLGSSLWLSREEETLAHMRFIEAMLLARPQALQPTSDPF